MGRIWQIAVFDLFFVQIFCGVLQFIKIFFVPLRTREMRGLDYNKTSIN